MTGSIRRTDEGLVAESNSLRVAIDDQGALRTAENLVTGQTLLDPDRRARPWRLIPQGTTEGLGSPWAVDAGYLFDEIPHPHPVFDVDPDRGLITWDVVERGWRVEVSLDFDDAGELCLWPRVEVEADAIPPAHLVFPTFEPASLSADGSHDRLLFPGHAGLLVEDPMDHPPLTGVYPDGYAGCSLQMMAYFTEGVGGFSLACHDTRTTRKELHFSAGRMSIRHDAWNLRRGATLALDYPVVLHALSHGDWWEAADLYRSWALTAPWAAAGANADRVGSTRPSWLFDEVGLSIWGAPSSLDWSDRYRWLRDAAGTPLHVVSGWDWAGTRPHDVGTEGWFPAIFDPRNLQEWKSDRVTPYMNDLFISVHAERFREDWEPTLIFPYVHFPFTVFGEPPVGWVDGDAAGPDPAVTTDFGFFVCPSTPQQAELHTWRDTKLVADYDLDGVFYDISSGNPFAARCLRGEHGHPPGVGRDILQAYADNNARSREAMEGAMGTVPAQGVETIVEHVIGEIDFYVSRAVGGPMGALEATVFGEEDPPGGQKTLVPLFQAVYHDVGPVHEDGWTTLARDEGDIFFWIGARLLLQWGGILSLHYANNPPERLPDNESAAVVAWDGATHVFDELPLPDASKQDFVAQLARCRTTYGNRHLAFGRMLRPPSVDVPTIELDYRRRLTPVFTALRKEGTWEVPMVVEAAWLSPESTVGLFFCNVHPTESLTVSPRFSLEHWGLDWEEVHARHVDADRATPLVCQRQDSGEHEVQVELPSRQIIMVELRRGAPA